MYFSQPIHNSGIDNVKFLAPIPVYQKVFNDDELHDRVYNLGLRSLSITQKRMGQELPEQLDQERIDNYEVGYHRKDSWVEDDDKMPIGSRYFTPPNNFLNFDNEDVTVINDRIRKGYKEIINGLGHNYTTKSNRISESWLQYYEPTAGRGHNQHNHCNWDRKEETDHFMFSGGYYLADGDPLLDHPYSGVFSFHLRDYQHLVRVKKGLLMMWPSDIVHSVKPFYGQNYRAVINFNIRSTAIKSKLL